MIKIPTEHVWYDDKKWKVVKIYSPSPHDDYVVLSRAHSHCCHSDGSDAVEMVLLNASNDEFYPDTSKVQRLLRQLNNGQKAFDKVRLSSQFALESEWHNTINPDET